MAEGGAAVSAAEHEAVGIIAKAAKGVLRDAEKAFAKRAAQDGLKGTAKDILRARERAAVEAVGQAGRDAARQVADRAAVAEKTITPKLESIERSLGGRAELAGKQFRLKDMSSLERKIATDALDDGVAPSVAASRINDAVRYTFRLSRDDYASGTEQIAARMRQEGFTPVKAAKNFWGGEGYQGINSVWRDASGQTFEVQFHTAESLAAKEETHELYNLARVFPSTDATAREIGALQNRVFGMVPTPPGAPGIRIEGG